MTQLKPDLETLRTLLDKHPEWADLPIGILLSNGEVDFVNWAGSVFPSDPNPEYKEWTGSECVLLFAPN